MTITLSPIIEHALSNRANEEGLSAPDFLKSFFFAAMHAREGITLKLERPKPEHDPAQPLLPLGGLTGASELS